MEVSRRKTTNGADGGSSSSHVPAVATVDELEVVIDAGERPSESRRIEKVPPVILKNEKSKGNYDPKVVSLGPYHHLKPELQSMENIKPKMAALFVSKSGKDVDEFKQEVLSMVGVARNCYVEGSTDRYCDAEFAEMMFLDGCFVLMYIELFTDSNFEMVTGYLNIIESVCNYGELIYTDIFLLENQLPLQLLNLLAWLKFRGTDKGIKMIDAYIDSLVSGDLQPHIGEEVKIAFEDIEFGSLHLLELLRKKMISGSGAAVAVKGKGSTKPRNIKELLHSFRSVSELKEKGIHFRPSKTPYLKDIEFESFFFYGELHLPTIYASEEDKLFLSNLIAYELCYPSDQSVIGFITFIKSLINHPDDVKELRSKGILFSSLSSDEEVVKMFNDITTAAIQNYESYANVKKRIQDHCGSKAKTWMAELIHKYFSGPWPFIAFLAATSVVLLTFIQTYYTVFKS